MRKSLVASLILHPHCQKMLFLQLIPILQTNEKHRTLHIFQTAWQHIPLKKISNALKCDRICDRLSPVDESKYLIFVTN